MTEMQRQFEEWAKSVSHNMASSERADLPYLSYETQIAYEAWQASRAALVVKLPISVCRTHVFEIKGSHEVGMEHDEYFEISDVTKSLDAAGVSYE